MNARTTSVAVRVAALVAALGTSWSLGLTITTSRRVPYPTLRPRRGPLPRTGTNVDVINAWTGTERDPLKLSQAERTAIVADTLSRVGDRPGLNDGALMLAIGGAWRRLLVERLRTGRTFPAPSLRWTQRKARLGLSTLHMRASGQLLAAIERAPVTTRVARP